MKRSIGAGLTAIATLGWWQIGTDGENMDTRATGLLWGDELADILDDALDQIRAAYRKQWGRPITHAELEAGFHFQHRGEEL